MTGSRVTRFWYCAYALTDKHNSVLLKGRKKRNAFGESITRGGEIYFIRERDYITGAVSPYVKIGLTRDDRVSAARQGDHQTGNTTTPTVIKFVDADHNL